MRGALKIRLAGLILAPFRSFQSPVAFKRKNKFERFPREYPVVRFLFWSSINVYSLFCDQRAIVSYEQICVKSEIPLNVHPKAELGSIRNRYDILASCIRTR